MLHYTAGVRALVLATGVVGTRVYPQRLPQQVVTPAVTYDEVSAFRELTHTERGFPEPRLQLTSWASTYGQLKDVAGAIFQALQGFSGRVTVGDDSVWIKSILLVGEHEAFEPTTELRQQLQDFRVSYQPE